MTYIYFGANLHINVLDVLTNPTKNIIYVDSLPKNEYGYEFTKIFYRPNFYNQLIKEFEKHNYSLYKYQELKPLQKMERYGWCNCWLPKYFYPTLLTFHNKDINKYIKYYISSGLPRYLTNELIQDMTTCNNIIISGHHPPSMVLSYLKLPLVVYAYTNTCYIIEDEDDKKTIIYNFINNPYYYLTIFLVNYDNNDIVKQCKDIQELENECRKYSKTEEYEEYDFPDNI